MNRSFEVCWYCPTNLVIDKFQESTEVLVILGVLEWGFSFRGSQLCKNLGLKLLLISDNCGAPFFCGQDNLLGGQCWAMGRLNLLGGLINLLGGQLTCYLPPWFKSIRKPVYEGKIGGMNSQFVPFIQEIQSRRFGFHALVPGSQYFFFAVVNIICIELSLYAVAVRFWTTNFFLL